MRPPDARSRGWRAPAALQHGNVGDPQSSTASGKRNRRILAAHLDARVGALLEVLAPDAAAQEAVRRIARRLEPTLDEVADEAGR